MKCIVSILLIIMLLGCLGCESKVPAYRNIKGQNTVEIPLSSIDDFVNLSKDYEQHILNNVAFSYEKSSKLNNYNDYKGLVDSFIEQRFCISYCSNFSHSDLYPYISDEVYNATKGYFLQLEDDLDKYDAVFFPREVSLNPGNIIKISESKNFVAINVQVNLYIRAEDDFFKEYVYLRSGFNMIYLWLYFEKDMKIVGWSETYNDVGTFYFTDGH